VQCVFREVQLPLKELDYRGMDPAAQDSAIKAYEAADRKKGFDFKSTPLMRLCLIRLDEVRYRMIWTSHHILFDGWSLPVLMEEFLSVYELLFSGQALPEKAEDRYEDYIRYLERRNKEGEESYWRNYLSGTEKGTLLPFMRAGKERTKGIGEYSGEVLILDSSKTTRVQSYAQTNRITVNTLMQGIWAWLLHQYTREESVLYGVVVSGRPDDLPGVENRVGMYINTLPFKATIRDDEQIVSWLQQLQGEQVASRYHQYTALQSVQEWTGIRGDLFDSLMVFENYPVSKLLTSKTWSLQIGNVEVIEKTNYPLTLIIGMAEELSINFSYNTNLLDQEYVRGIRDQFEQVLGQITGGQADTLNDISLLTAKQEQQLLYEFNNTRADYPQDKGIIELFEEQVIKNPGATAVVFGEEQLTYKGLNEKANQLAHYLQKRGVKEETLVPICVERSLEMIVGILGILKAGGAYVPIDPGYPEDRISYMLEDTGAELVLGTKASRSKLTGTQEVISLDGDWPAINKAQTGNLQTEIRPEQLAYVIYTSGSTGKPKGVMIEHRNLSNLIAWHNQAYEVTASSKATSMAGVGFDAFGWEVWPYLSAGASVCIINDDTRVLPSALLALFNERGITHSFISTALVVDFIEVSRYKTGPLKYLLTGGDKLSVSSLEGINYTFVNNYGPTENTVVATNCLVSKEYNVPPIGKPISNTQVYILNTGQQLSPIGVTGELYIGGAQVARGYLNNPELTREKFISDPFSSDPTARIYRTGDLGRWLPDGNIEYQGRMDEQVKIRGYRIELGEIESVLNQSPLVQ